jgi:hypothetical protein
MKKMGKTLVTAVALLTALAFIVTLSGAEDYADYYDSYGSEYFFDSNDLYCYSDYALVTCEDFGGGFEDTDFAACTYALGSNVFKLTKVITVTVEFYDNDNYHTQGTDTTEVYYSDNTGEYATVYGAGHVNEEYGLDTFTSYHELYFYDIRNIDPDTGDPERFDYHRIYIDTTGFYR